MKINDATNAAAVGEKDAAISGSLCVQPRPINQVFSNGGRTVTGSFSFDMNGASGQLYSYFQNIAINNKFVVIERMFCVKEQLADISIAGTSEQILDFWRCINGTSSPGSWNGTQTKHRNGMEAWNDNNLNTYLAESAPMASFPFLVLKTRTAADQFWSMDVLNDGRWGTGPIVLQSGETLGLVGRFASPVGAGANASKIQLSWTVSLVNEF